MFSKNESLKVKGIAILMLLFHHLFYSTERIAESGMSFLLFPQEVIQAAAIMARICVWMFVFVSAYGLTVQYILHSYESNKIKFVLKSWISLMKTYWFVYVAVFLLLVFTSTEAIQKYENSIVYAVLDFWGWSDFFATPSLSGVWWYMCFAQILVCAIPLLNSICEKLGWSSLLMAFFCMQYVSDGIKSSNGGRYSNYLLVAILAVLCARNKVFDTLSGKKTKAMGKVGKFIVLFTVIGFMMCFKYKFADYDRWQLNSFLSAIITFLICYLISVYFKNEHLEQILICLGKHSGNIFMIHAILYTYYPDIIYWSGNAIVSYVTLLILSIAVSMIFEKIKSKIRYDEWFKKFTNKVMALTILEEA